MSCRGNGAGLAGLVLLALTTTGCRSAAFSFATSQPPRLTVIHRPLNPAPDQEIVLEAWAEAAPGRRVTEVRIDFFGSPVPARDGLPGSSGHLTTICRDGAACTLRVPPRRVAGQGLYTASMRDDGGRSVNARSGYSFVVGRPTRGIVPLRVPVNLLVDDSVFKILLVRDRDSYPVDDRGALADIEALLYDGLLADPALRWRDHQLAFYGSSFPGVTRGYHSGLRSRCGQAPWLGTEFQADAEDEANRLSPNVVAVIHLRAGERDCAGLQEGGGSRGLSAHGRNPAAFTHEVGHALFGLGDEYWESGADRATRPAAGPPADPALCSCCTPSLGAPCLLDQPECTGFDRFPPECFPAPPACPPIESTCARPNLFSSQLACQEAAAEILLFPGLAGSVVAADCRRLCGPAGPPCPCLPSSSIREVWILDRRRPARGGAGPDDDLMGNLDAASPQELLGPACQRCIETAFCIAWEQGRGRTPTQVAAHCGASP